MSKVYTLFNLFPSFILAKNPHRYPVVGESHHTHFLYLCLMVLGFAADTPEPRPSGSGIPIDNPINPPLDDVPNPWDATDPNIASSNQAAPMLDDIRVKYHPKAKVPPKVFSFENYGREQDKPPARAFVKDP